MNPEQPLSRPLQAVLDWFNRNLGWISDDRQAIAMTLLLLLCGATLLVLLLVEMRRSYRRHPAPPPDAADGFDPVAALAAPLQHIEGRLDHIDAVLLALQGSLEAGLQAVIARVDLLPQAAARRSAEIASIVRDVRDGGAE
jgi:hypothetical protein